MDFDGTLSTELAMLRKQANELKEVITHGLPLTNDGKKMKCQFGTNMMIIPKGAKNVAGAKNFAKMLIQPEINGRYLKGGLGRWLPIFPELVKDAWWTDPKQDAHRPPYVELGFGGGATIPFYFTYNPAWSQVRSEHPFNIAFHDVTAGGMKSTDAVEKAYKRIEEIFTKFEIKT